VYRQVPTLAVLTGLQGGIEILAGAVAGLVALSHLGALLAAMAASESPGVGLLIAAFGVAPAWYGFVAIALTFLGAYKVRCAFRLQRFQGRSAALTANLLSGVWLLTCVCFPLGLALPVFTWRVLEDAESKAAFELGEQGMDAESIYRRLLERGPAYR
jgi:hypothetical protein